MQILCFDTYTAFVRSSSLLIAQKSLLSQHLLQVPKPQLLTYFEAVHLAAAALAMPYGLAVCAGVSGFSAFAHCLAAANDSADIFDEKGESENRKKCGVS